MTDLRSDALAVLATGFDGTGVPHWLANRLAEGLGGVWLFGGNVESAEQATKLCDEIHRIAPTTLICADEEGGTVTRLHQSDGSPYPSHLALGAVDDPDLTRGVAHEIGADAAAMGIDVVAAPVADVNAEAANPVIGVRSFGADTDLVARHTAAFVRGLHDGGVLACAKHFPGHGSTTQDSHLSLPVVDVSPDLLRERDLPPFTAAIEAGTRLIMTAHIVVPAYGDQPATLNADLLELARSEGFDGVICSDALDMHAISHSVGRTEGAIAALNAGVDLLCIGNPAFPDPYDADAVLTELIDAIEAAVKSGRVPRTRLAEAAARVRALGGQRRSATPPGTRASADVAAKALRIRGEMPRLATAQVVDLTRRTDIAAGRKADPVATHLHDRLNGSGGLVVVTDLSTDTNDPEVEDLIDRSDLVVHTGFADPASSGPDWLADARAVVVTHGGGRATAEAIIDLLRSAPTKEK